jgi:hypothetical protein
MCFQRNSHYLVEISVMTNKSGLDAMPSYNNTAAHHSISEVKQCRWRLEFGWVAGRNSVFFARCYTLVQD